MAKYNRRYKDSVFVDLFSEDKTAKANFYRYIMPYMARTLIRR